MLYQYNNIYASSCKYLKEKKHKLMIEKKKKKTIFTIAMVSIKQTKRHKTFIFSRGWSQSNILLFYFDL